jgi:hypothetical protein
VLYLAIGIVFSFGLLGAAYYYKIRAVPVREFWIVLSAVVVAAVVLDGKLRGQKARRKVGLICVLMLLRSTVYYFALPGSISLFWLAVLIGPETVIWSIVVDWLTRTRPPGHRAGIS